jgi:hypothetical protein
MVLLLGGFENCINIDSMLDESAIELQKISHPYACHKRHNP